MVVRVVRRGFERHVTGAYAMVAAASCRPIVHQQFERCAMQIHIVAVVAIGIGHGGVGLRSSCQDSCLREGHVLTFVEVCDVRGR